MLVAYAMSWSSAHDAPAKAFRRERRPRPHLPSIRFSQAMFIEMQGCRMRGCVANLPGHEWGHCCGWPDGRPQG
jgi:hypothetical protein